jgi:hypothetical protein
MPPCQRVVVNKIKRTNYLTRLIKNADRNFIEDIDPSDHGWIKLQNKIEIQFYDGNQFPENLASRAVDEIDEQIRNNDEYVDAPDNVLELDFSSDSDTEEIDED